MLLFVTLPMCLPSPSGLRRDSERHHHHPEPGFAFLPQWLFSLHLLPLGAGCSGPGIHQGFSPDLRASAQPELLHKLFGDEGLAGGECCYP